jgi:hypothetical protein
MVPQVQYLQHRLSYPWKGLPHQKSTTGQKSDRADDAKDFEMTVCLLSY